MKDKPDYRLRRVRYGPLASSDAFGMNGAFHVEGPRGKLQIIASDQGGWEHVSITINNAHRCPTWEEMCFIKALFWNDDETVIQYHPSKSEYVNNHPFVLHLWKPIGVELPIPPSIFVGIK